VGVDNLDLERRTRMEAEADPPRIVDADAVLPFAVTMQFLQPVSGRRPEIVHDSCRVEHVELPARAAANLRRDSPGYAAVKQLLRLLIRKRSYHRITGTR
jgi:hypothetical protein